LLVAVRDGGVPDEDQDLARSEVEKLRTRSVDVDKIKELFDSSCSVMAQTEAIFKSIGRQAHGGRILIHKHA
jgi:hypothetical protein